MIKLIEAYISENKAEERAVRNNLEILIKHMLKCKYINEYPNKSNWRKTVYNAHINLIFEFKAVGKGRLYKNYYIKQLDLNKIYKLAVINVSEEIGKSKTCFPSKCEWKLTDFVNDQFIDDFIDKWGQDCD